MLKKLIAILVFALTLAWPGAVYAHVLQTDGSIGAIMHVDPDDEPIVNQQSAFFFEFKDLQNKFEPKNCDCNFYISENNQLIYSQPLFQNNSSPSLENASVFYTFNKKDVYQVKVTGQPLVPGQFQNFTLTYNVRVDRESNTPSPNANSPSWISIHLIHIIGVGIILLFFLVALLKQVLDRGSTNKK